MALEQLSAVDVEPFGATDVIRSGSGGDVFPGGPCCGDDLLDHAGSAEPETADADGATDLIWSGSESDVLPSGPCCAADVIGRPADTPLTREITSDARHPRTRRTP